MQDAMGAENYEKYRSFIRLKESGKPEGNYGIPDNGFGYAGAYQFGAQALQQQGLIKPGIETDYKKLGNTPAERAAAHKALMNDDSNWTIPGGKQAFLNNKELQDRAFDNLSNSNFSALSKGNPPLITSASTPDQIAGYGAASHLLGAGAVKAGRINETDANGTRGASYFKGAAAAVNGASTAVPNVPGKTGTDKTGGTKPPPRAIYNGSDRKLGESRIPNSVTIGTSIPPVNEIPVPFPNPLGEFASFNYAFTFSNISASAHRKPEDSYKAGDLGEIVIRSGGAGNFAQSTAMTTKGNPEGKYDFFIDNLDIEAIMSHDRSTKGSNATKISFDVTEPYSMGVFLQACHLAALKNKWPNGYLGSVFLLTIEFIGFNENGEASVIPNTTRHIPMIIQDIEMSVKKGGAVYKVTGHPSNEIALANNNRLFDVDLAVSGKTVQEVLQSGEFSLQTVINKRLQEFAEKEKAPTAFDEIVIIFPKVNENVLKNDKEEKSATNRTTSTITVSRRDSSSNLIQDQESLNDIGKSAMDFDASTSGETRVNKQNEVQDDPKNPVKRNKVVYDAKTRQFIYSQGTSIINAISSILVNSKYCKDSAEKNKTDKNGMIDWFRIETQVDYLDSKPGNVGNNDQAKLLIFKIVPYKAHSERNTATSSPVKGYDELRKEVAKVYDYIYTGKNTEVINFDLEFKGAFFNTLARDQNKQNKDTFYGTQQSATADGNSAPKTPDNTPRVLNRLSGNTRAGQEFKVDPNEGGTTANDYRTLIAKTFQNALYDSETDLIQGTLTVFGDPYYLADSGMGNFTNTGSGRFNVTKTNAMDYQSGEVDIVVNFRTPLDYDAETGIMSFGNTEIVEQFSGLYQVTFVNNRFQKGKFTQELKLLRRKRQSAETVEKVTDNSASIGINIYAEDGTLSNIRRNPETGELYDATGLPPGSDRFSDRGQTAKESTQGATADPKTKQAVVTATTRTSPASASSQMTDADSKSTFNGAP